MRRSTLAGKQSLASIGLLLCGILAIAECSVGWKPVKSAQGGRHKEGCEDPAASSLQEGFCKFTFANKKQTSLKHLSTATGEAHKMSQTRCDEGWHVNALGYCEKQQAAAPRQATDRRDYNCPYGWHLGADGFCFFGEGYYETPRIACPDGYFLTQDNFCREIRFLPPPPPTYRICDMHGYCRDHLVRLSNPFHYLKKSIKSQKQATQEHHS